MSQSVTNCLVIGATGFVGEALCTRLGCEIPIIALPLLGFFAAAIGNTRQLECRNGWLSPALLWTCVVGQSGTSKTSGYSICEKLFEKHQAQLRRATEKERKEFKREDLFYKRELSKFNKGEINLPPTAPEPPVIETFHISNATIEAIARRMIDNPRGLFLAMNELHGWLGSFEAYGKTNAQSAPFWLERWDNSKGTIDRVADDISVDVPAVPISIAGCSTWALRIRLS